MRFICVLLAVFAFAAAEDYKYLPDTYEGNTAIFKPFKTEVYKGKKASVNIDKNIDTDVNINFAGKYYINGFSCMSDTRPVCRSLRMVDLSSALGDTIDLDNHIIDYDNLIKEYVTFSFERSYTLMIAQYHVFLDEDTLRAYKTVYFDFKDGKFVELKRAYAYPNDIIKYMDQRAHCDHFRGEQDGESEMIDSALSAQLDKYCGNIEQVSEALRDRYKTNREILKVIDGYGYQNR